LTRTFGKRNTIPAASGALTGGYDDAGWLAAAVEIAVSNVHEGGGPFGAVTRVGERDPRRDRRAPT
jgi:hypothetical protein